MNIAGNVRRIREAIDEAALRAGAPGDITLVAATKTIAPERIQEAITAGITDCGENRVQEMLQKLPLGAYEGARLHFIGHLQSNKVKQVVGAASLIQSVDSKRLVSLIGARARALDIVQDVLIEINIGGEASKSGVSPDRVEELLGLCAAESGIFVKGLMAIPPIADENNGNRLYFEQMYKLFVDISTKKYDNIKMEILSMGMSADYEEAILAGANMIRIGSAIFGPRLVI
jgi:pyridoxal phosphate enzyme (YggS family)